MLHRESPAEHDEWDACVVEVDDGVGEPAGFEEGEEEAVSVDCVLRAGEEGEGCGGGFELRERKGQLFWFWLMCGTGGELEWCDFVQV